MGVTYDVFFQVFEIKSRGFAKGQEKIFGLCDALHDLVSF